MVNEVYFNLTVYLKKITVKCVHIYSSICVGYKCREDEIVAGKMQKLVQF